MKMFPKLILEPLISSGVIESCKTTAGRGAKPLSVTLTEKGKGRFLRPFLKGISTLAGIDSAELNTPLSQILVDVQDEDNFIKGKALEILTIWMIRICSLRFTAWRKRDAETGRGEVDVLAASDTFVYSRWQIQCKNTKRVDVDVVAKEVGMTFMTGADIVMIVTTGKFTSDAIQYADSLCTRSRYYLILVDGDHLKQISDNKIDIVTILNRIAKRTFVRKEYGMSNTQSDEVVEDYETQDELGTELEFEE